MAAATTNIGSLTTTFTPAATCLSYFQARNKGNTWLQYGTVGSDANDCFPSGFNPLPGPYYSPGVCPHGYEYQYPVVDGSTTAATCCPSGYTRQSKQGSDDANACRTTFDKHSQMTISIWTIISSRSPGLVNTTVFTQEEGKPAYARGIVVRRSGNDPTWPGVAHAPGSTKASTKGDTAEITPGATPDTPDSARPTGQPGAGDGSPANDGLSSSAKIGIGVGVTLGVLLIIGSAIAAFLLGKRRRRGRQVEEAEQRTTEEQTSKPPAYQTKTTGVIDETSVRYPGELSAYVAPAELDAVSGRR
ncbi:hypothetical protein PG987_011689 [Apiospora arundinis]